MRYLGLLFVLAAVGCGGGGSAVPNKDGGAGTGGQSQAGSAGAVGSAGSGTAGSSSSGAAGADAGMPDGAMTGTAGATSSGAAGAAGQGTAGQGAAGSSAPTLAATWTYPAMIAMGTATITFPSYAAHLLGKTITEPFPTDLACATVANTGASAATAHLSVSLGTYGAAVTADVSVPATSSKKTCLTPTLNKTALYALTAPDTAALATSATEGAVDIGSSSMNVNVQPVDDIAWSADGVDAKTLKEMSVVYVEPNAPDIDTLQRLAQQHSVFAQWPDSYERAPYLRTTAALSPGGAPASEGFIFEPSEVGTSVSWTIQSITCSSLCTNMTVDVALFTSDQFTAFTAGTSTTAMAVWSAQVSGAQNSQVIATAGQYVLAFFNNNSNFTDRTVQWKRSVTKEDVVRDVLLSTFSALRAANLTYSTVTDTFFTGWQHVRRVTQSLEDASANCIDGSFVFASVAELLGMQPVLILKTAHAYMGIRSAIGSPVIWPIETTLVGSTATPLQAYGTAITNRAADMATDPNYQEIDVATLRSRGVTPLVQQ
jgi:hypothetical protein